MPLLVVGDREQDRAEQVRPAVRPRLVQQQRRCPRRRVPRRLESLLRAEVDAKTRLYSAMAAVVSRGEVRPVDAGHVTLPFRQPGAVLEAIRDVVDS